MAEENRDVRLKDGDIYLYPLAREDDTGRVIRDTYLTKTGEDSYICEASVESYVDPTTGLEVNVLTLVNKNNPENPIRFVGGDGGYATWGFIKGEITAQGDLVTYTDRAISLQVNQKNKIFKQATVPEDTSEYTLQDGDMWYVTGEVEGYSLYRWYVYRINGCGAGTWELTADQEIAENTSRISVTNEKIETEVTAREGADAVLSSTITQTATGIKLEVGQLRTRYTEPTDEPPKGSEENPIMPGDLWYCSDASKGYTKDTWYIYKDGAWAPATEEETRTVSSKIDQQADRITSEVNRIDGDIVTANTRIDQTATDITLEAEARELADNEEVKNRNAAIKVSADQISLKVTEEKERAEGVEGSLSGKIDVQAGKITSEVERAENAESALSSKIEQTEESLTASIAGVDNKYSVVKQTVDGWSFTTTEGETVINGSKIKTGTIDASKVTISGHLSAASINAGKLVVNGQTIGSSTNKLDDLYTKSLRADVAYISTLNNMSVINATGNVKIEQQSGSSGGNLYLVGNVSSNASFTTTLNANGVTHGGVTATWANIISGGTAAGDYSKLTNKPKINGVELTGNKTTSDLGIIAVFG